MVNKYNFNVVPNDEQEEFTVDFGETIKVVENDFNQLENRPSYAGTTMTGDTNIPEVPTAVSQLQNDADYQTWNEVDAAIGTEAQARSEADATLQTNIDTVDGKVTAEKTAREQADQTLKGNIEAEETARQNADINLQGQIDAITSASDVVDIVGTYAELQNYDTQHIKDNDVIKVLQDETHNNAMSYYRWSTSTSTWTYIGSEGPYYTKSESDTLLLAKQDKLTAGNNIQINNNTISATDTTYTAGNGLTLTGTEFSADTTVLQGKLTAGDGITISNNTISANIDPADFFTAGETVSGEGTDITLNNTISAPLESVELDGDTYQQTYSGKNLFDINSTVVQNFSATSSVISGNLRVTNGYSGSSHSVALKVGNTQDYSGKTLTLKTLWSSSGANTGRMYIGTSDSDGNNRTSLGNIVTSGGSVTVTIPTNITSTNNTLIIMAYSNNNSAQIGDYVDYSQTQLEVGSSPSAYEPYVGGTASPNPDYPQNVQVVTGEQNVWVHGKNLLDLNSFVKGRVDNGVIGYADGTSSLTATDNSITFTTNTNYRGVASGLIPVNPNVSYVFSSNSLGSASRYTDFYDSSKNWISRATSNPATTPANCAYVRISFQLSSTGTITITNPQFEQGSATAYEPYQGNNYTVDLGSIELCKIGDYQDYIYKSGGDWYVHNATMKATLNGTEDWELSSATTGYTRANIRNVGFPTQIGYCDRFTPRVGAHGAYEYVWFQPITIGGLYIQIKTERLADDTLAAFKTWLSNNPTKVVYALATPTDTKITDSTLIGHLDALYNAKTYLATTSIMTTATGTNLPVILDIVAYRKSLAGMLGAIERLSE